MLRQNSWNLETKKNTKKTDIVNNLNKMLKKYKHVKTKVYPVNKRNKSKIGFNIPGLTVAGNCVHPRSNGLSMALFVKPWQPLLNMQSLL